MKRQVNMFLVLLVFVGILAVGGISLFYQERLSTLGSGFVDASNNYEVCNTTLTQAQLQLEQTRAQLQANIGDVNKTVGLFQQSQDNLLDLQRNLDQRDSQITSLEQTVRNKNAEIAQLEATIRERDDIIKQLNEEIEDLKQEIEWLEEDLDNCG